MHESARELDQSLEEQIIRLPAVSEPELLQHIVCFVKKLLIEALEIAEVMRIQRVAAKVFNHCRDARRFPAHRFLIQRRAFSSGRGSEPAGVVVTGIRKFKAAWSARSTAATSAAVFFTDG